MSWFALGLLIAAAALHAGWNLLLKQAGEKYIAIWWAAMLSAVFALPALFFGNMPALEIWPYILLSALVEVAYMATLASAYEQGDFSLIYPIARGAAPALLSLWAVLFLGDRPTPLGVFGLALLIAGLLVVGSSDWWAQRGRTKTSLSGIALALLVALLISIYSAIDGAAVQRTDPTMYSIVMLGLTGPFFAPFVLRRYGWRMALAEGRAHWLNILLIGVLSLLAYALVLNVYAIAPVSYAGAIREVSIVFAALVGWRLLGEKLGGVRILGSILIFAGILVIALS